jgi:hypothetical protein
MCLCLIAAGLNSDRLRAYARGCVTCLAVKLRQTLFVLSWHRLLGGNFRLRWHCLGRGGASRARARLLTAKASLAACQSLELGVADDLVSVRRIFAEGVHHDHVCGG